MGLNEFKGSSIFIKTMVTNASTLDSHSGRRVWSVNDSNVMVWRSNISIMQIREGGWRDCTQHIKIKDKSSFHLGRVKRLAFSENSEGWFQNTHEVTGWIIKQMLRKIIVHSGFQEVFTSTYVCVKSYG